MPLIGASLRRPLLDYLQQQKDKLQQKTASSVGFASTINKNLYNYYQIISSCVFITSPPFSLTETELGAIGDNRDCDGSHDNVCPLNRQRDGSELPQEDVQEATRGGFKKRD